MQKCRIGFDPALPSEVLEVELGDIATKVAWPRFDDARETYETKETGLEGKRPNSNTIRKYIVEASALPLLSQDEERKLFRRYIRGRNLVVRDRIICHNLRLVISVAKHYVDHGLDFLDLIQEGNLGLMRSIEKFDVERGFRFSTCAILWIRNSIMLAIANNGQTIRFPVRVSESIRSLGKFEASFIHKNGRRPSTEELADLSGVDTKKARRLQVMKRNLHNIASFEEAVLVPKRDSEDLTIGSLVSDRTSWQSSFLAEARLEFALALRDLGKLKSRLARWYLPRDMEIYLCRYGLFNGSFEQQTLEQVATTFGMSREHVRQIVLGINRRLRKNPKEMQGLSRRLSQLSELSTVVSETGRSIKTSDKFFLSGGG